MKKKKSKSVESPDDGEIFPVDTLGIPILVEVVQASAITSDTEKEVESECQPDNPGPSDLEYSTELPVEPRLDQITDNIIASVIAEITVLVEPIVRGKVNLALQKYQAELQRLASKEHEEKSSSD